MSDDLTTADHEALVDRAVLRMVRDLTVSVRDWLASDPRYLSAEVTAETLARQLTIMLGEPDLLL